VNDHLPLSLQRLDGTVGVWTASIEALPAAQSHEAAQAVEAAGFSALWVAEAWGRESFTNASLLLAGTTTLTIATGITNIFGRDPVAAAAASRTLNAAYADRFVLGLGVSHQPLVEGLRGHTYATPLAAMRDYVTKMDAATMFAPESGQRYARLLAALGPKMIQLAAETSDGVHPYLVTPEHTARTRGLVGDKFIGVEQAVVLGQDREEFLRRAHEHLEIYTGLDNYRRSWERLGFDDSDFGRGGSDRLCDALVVHGDEQAILSRIQEHRDAGANHVCLQVLGNAMMEVPYDDWQRIGEVVNHQ
jgi:probable F420-dependent oxidoreductase